MGSDCISSWSLLIFLLFIYLDPILIYISRCLNRLPVWNSQNCSMFPLAFVARWLQGHWWGFISRNYVVWPTFLLMNVFIALKGSHFWFLSDFSDQFKKIIVRYKRIGYNINIMRQSACLVFNPITVNNFASLFNCTPVGRASDSMMAPT